MRRPGVCRKTAPAPVLSVAGCCRRHARRVAPGWCARTHAGGGATSPGARSPGVTGGWSRGVLSVAEAGMRTDASTRSCASWKTRSPRSCPMPVRWSHRAPMRPTWPPGPGQMTEERRSGRDRREVPTAGRRAAGRVACPQCQHGVSVVADSRSVKRLRVCTACGCSFITEERVVRLAARGSRRLAPADYFSEAPTRCDRLHIAESSSTDNLD
jgi:transcription elongation factor Elf1